MSHIHSPKLDNFYRHKYKEIISEESSKQPLEVREKPEGNNTDYFATTYGITLHYLDRYIERIYLKDSRDYKNKDKMRLAEMLQDTLPLIQGISITHIEDGIVSIIRKGIAITVYPEGTKEITKEI